MSFTKEQAEEMQRRVDAAKVVHWPIKDGVVQAKANLSPRPSKMNKSEQAYARHLESLLHLGQIAHYKYEAVTLKLGDDCRYTADFLVIGTEGQVELHDVKAKWQGKGKVHIEDDARVKLSVASSTVFPFFTFKTVWLDQGIWHSKTY